MNDVISAPPMLTLQPCDAHGSGTADRHEPVVPPTQPPVLPQPAALVGRVLSVCDVTETDRVQMYALLAAYFRHTSRAVFERDLAEKEWVVLLRAATTGVVQGFSTLMRLTAVIDQQPVVAFFSGDTIIHRDYWGETILPRLWAQHVFRLAASITNARVYWLLICSGYKTYRFLPVFFQEFYPTYACSTPPHYQRIMDTFARQKFGAEYDAVCGVVRLTQATPLHTEVAAITPQRLRDPHVAFFVTANPGHTDGVELVCLTELTSANLTAAGRRMVR